MIKYFFVEVVCVYVGMVAMATAATFVMQAFFVILFALFGVRPA